MSSVNGRLLCTALLSLCQACLADFDTAPARTTPPLLEEEEAVIESGSGSVELCRRPPLQSLRYELPVWDLLVPSRGWDALHEDVTADVQVDAVICIDGRAYPIGLELQGASTRHAPKKSFDLKFDRGLPLASVPFRDALGDGADDGPYERILMKAMHEDQSLIREALAFDLWREMGHEAPRIGFVNLRINGDHWGLYVLVEPVNKAYLRRHGYAPGGTLYKAVRKHGELADFAPGRDLTLAYENKTDEDDPSREDLEALVRKLQRTPLEQEAFEREIDPIFPLDEYMERLIWVAFTQNGDAVAQNFFLYNAPEAGHDRFHQIPWDSNLCFSADWRDSTRVRPPEASLLVDGRNHFGRRLVRVDGVRETYVERFLEVMDHVLTPEIVLEHHDRHARAVARDLALDRERWEREIAPDDAFAVLVDFFERRPAALRAELSDLLARHGPPPMDPPEDAVEDPAPF